MAQIDPVFTRIIRRLRQQAERTAFALTGASGSVSEHLQGEQPETDVHDSRAIHRMFQRQRAQSAYDRAITGREESEVRHGVSAKIQNDFLAAMERDYKSRYRRRLETYAHEASRRMTHSEDSGPIARRMNQPEQTLNPR